MTTSVSSYRSGSPRFGTVKTYMQKMRFNKDSKNKKDQAPKTNRPKDVEANVTVVADYKKLMKDHEELKLKYHAIEEDRSNLEIEISQLKQELVNRNEDYLTLQEEVSELRQLQKPIKQDQYFVQDSPDNEIKLLRDSNDYLYQENLALKVRARAYKSTIRELIAEQGV